MGMEKAKTYNVKSVMIGRMPRKEGEMFKTASFGFYDVNNPHITGEFPTDSIEVPNIEKVRIIGLQLTYYLEGNDLIINDLEELTVTPEEDSLVITGKQNN